jgi:PleD family two-component response regulator
MHPENKTTSNASTSPLRKALVVDDDKDRYRRKERISVIQHAGFKVYPVLRLQDAGTRCRPGSFDLVVVSASQNVDLAVDVCDQIKRNDPNQRLFLVAQGGVNSPDRDYVLRDWSQLSAKLGPTRSEKDEHKPEHAAA